MVGLFSRQFQHLPIVGLDFRAPCGCQSCAALSESQAHVQLLSADVVRRRAGGSAENGDSDACMVCGEASGGRVTLLCDGCDAACHLKCTQPRLRRTPPGDWFCINWCAIIPRIHGGTGGSTIGPTHQASSITHKSVRFLATGTRFHFTSPCSNVETLLMDEIQAPWVRLCTCHGHSAQSPAV